MATCRLCHIILNDGWPGAVNPNLGIPCDGWDNTVHNFNTGDDTAKAFDPPVPPGTKIMSYTDNTVSPGNYTMMYMCFHDYSELDITKDFSDGLFWCGKSGLLGMSTSHLADGSKAPYYVVGRCYTAASAEITEMNAIAVPCCEMSSDGTVSATNGYGDFWGWFWVGGVCPAKECTIMSDLTYGSTCWGGVDVTCAHHSGNFWILQGNNVTMTTDVDPSTCLHGFADMSAAS
jgi:hypothetical protein